MKPVSLPRVLLAAGAWLWLGAVTLAPHTVFPVGRFICHQRPERSFFVMGKQMAVCARCTGLYAGAALTAPFALLALAPLASSRARRLLAVAALPTALTWSTEFLGVAHFTNMTRFVAALPLGFAAAWLVFAAFAEPARARVPPASR